MTQKSRQFALKPATAAMTSLLVGLAWLASAVGLPPSQAAVEPPAATADGTAETVPKAEPPPGDRACVPPAVDPALIRELTAWIADHTDYDTSRAMRDPPRVTFCDTGETISYEGKDVIVDAQLRAAYDLRRRRIFLVLPWSAASTRDVSTLLHELLHDVQFSDRAWPCKGKAEWEAYKLQEVWLAEQGLASGFDWPQIFLLSRCPRDVHP